MTRATRKAKKNLLPSIAEKMCDMRAVSLELQDALNESLTSEAAFFSRMQLKMTLNSVLPVHFWDLPGHAPLTFHRTML